VTECYELLESVQWTVGIGRYINIIEWGAQAACMGRVRSVASCYGRPDISRRLHSRQLRWPADWLSSSSSSSWLSRRQGSDRCVAVTSRHT